MKVAVASDSGERHAIRSADVEPDIALRDLGEWIAQGLLPEVIPTRQQRSLRSTLAMLDAGRMLLQDRSLEDLSLETVCQAAGTTIGTFYGRFEHKLAFFVTLQRIHTIRSQAVIGEMVRRYAHDAPGLDELCEQMVSVTVRNFRSNTGVLRASLQHTKEGMWDLFRESGDRYRSVLEEQLSLHLEHHSPAVRQLRILFAYQALAGVLVHATLNDPGPLSLEDDRLIPELVRLVRAYLISA
ncbi:TetR/AcrR family transcriptional regulator [Variovorax sp. LARHSF232]